MEPFHVYASAYLTLCLSSVLYVINEHGDGQLQFMDTGMLHSRNPGSFFGAVGFRWITKDNENTYTCVLVQRDGKIHDVRKVDIRLLFRHFIDSYINEKKKKLKTFNITIVDNQTRYVLNSTMSSKTYIRKGTRAYMLL